MKNDTEQLQSTGRPAFHYGTGKSTHQTDIDYIRTNIPCQWACPALTNIPGYIQAIYEGENDIAYDLNKRSNLFPGVLGRICSRPCEVACRHGDTDLGEPVSICHLKRVAADNTSDDHLVSEQLFAQTGKTIGIVGAGPAGLAVAHSLALFGHRVTLYEALPKVGGMLLYGIPAFRLPRDILEEEIFNILRQGIEYRSGVRLGVDTTLPDLLAKHDAVVMAMGCYQENVLGITNEDMPGVHSGLEFMMNVNQGVYPEVGKRVLVIGGGFTAMDCARTAKRLGAEDITICIRRVESDLTVTWEEIVETKREGIRFSSLISPVEAIGGDHLERVRFVRNRLGGKSGGGRRRVLPIEGSEFITEVDTVISAIGQGPIKGSYGLPEDTPIKFDPITGAANVPGLFGAGDFLTGATTVIGAIGHARDVSVTIDKYLIGRQRRQKTVIYQAADDTVRKRFWDFIPKHHIPTLSMEERFSDLEAEVETGFDEKTGIEEAKRCYLCNLKYEIHIPKCIYCRWCIEVCPRDCILLVKDLSAHPGDAAIRHFGTTNKWNEVRAIVIDSDRCIRCGECLRICPTECIHVARVDLIDDLVTKEA